MKKLKTSHLELHRQRCKNLQYNKYSFAFPKKIFSSTYLIKNSYMYARCTRAPGLCCSCVYICNSSGRRLLGLNPAKLKGF
jgi:hypothetical protein